MNAIHFHRRNLPHIYKPFSSYFITFRLKGSLPLQKLYELKQKYDRLEPKTKEEKYENLRNFFVEYDELLHKNKNLIFLKEKQIAEIVKSCIHYYDGKKYNLFCFTIMPNHVHQIFHLPNDKDCISDIMKGIKGYSAYQINKVFNKKGGVWQEESYDHIVRDEDELFALIEYTLMNPVKAGLVENWKDWEHSYLAENFKWEL
ncbi:MAG: hypothetical protein GXO87_00155 [Chlorobi bacterium]|nr:hypothetical protein [Chlorobiota bacterium]